MKFISFTVFFSLRKTEKNIFRPLIFQRKKSLQSYKNNDSRFEKEKKLTTL
jgi:hypothetical protein